MTHGEEPGSETRQDSAVLTYLEGLLMHRVAGGPGATAERRAEPGGMQDGQEQRPGVHTADDPLRDRRPPPPPPPGCVAAASSQHLRKARLLRSEGWAGDAEAGTGAGLRARGAEPALNGRGVGAGAPDASPKCPAGESTLLASLLQSFSSRLQTVALSQQIMHGLKPPEPTPPERGPTRQAPEPRPCLGAASSRLKGFLKKSRMQSLGSVPYRRRAGPERPVESPQPPAAATSDSLSCAERLKAVASLVNTRASPAPPAPSPAPSPRPSVACSQLALLLSSEAHLQRYSREQALKARLSGGRSASERLAAMATQQARPAPDAPLTSPTPPTPPGSSNGGGNGTLSPPGRAGSGGGGGVPSPRGTPPQRERRGFDRNPVRPSQNCSSLLLHLLNNHNAQRRSGARAPSPGDRGSSPLRSDGEQSHPENGLPRDGSDAESSRSGSSPIDLSVRGRAAERPPGSSSSASPSLSSSSSSLDKLTESLINRWRPENPPPPRAAAAAEEQEEKEARMGLQVRPHHKVTLLQLLLDHRNGEGSRAQRRSDNPDPRQGVLSPPPGRVGVAPGAGVSLGRLTPVCRSGGDGSSARSPHGRPPSRGFQAPPSFPQRGDLNGSVSLFTPCPAPPPAQSAPLNLCKSKGPSNPNPNPDPNVQEAAFTASKLLQNLAQCGLQTLKTPLPPATPGVEPPVTLLERLNAPILRNGTPVSDIPQNMSNGSPVLDTSRTNSANPADRPSEIESLLERRTVLQLLLGTAGGPEKLQVGGGTRKRVACGGPPSEWQPNQSSHTGNSLDVKIKTEPGEDSQEAVSGGKAVAEPFLSRGGGESEKLRPLSAPHHMSVKPEPVSPGAVPRDGLLSQLLKQQCRKLPVNAPTAGVMSAAPAAVKEEPSEAQAPPTVPQTPPGDPQAPPIPKKRRVCVDGFPRERPVGAAGGDGGDFPRSASRSPERPAAARNGRSPTEAVSPSRGNAGSSPPADARGGGFNVLKQLLLSDNCLKELQTRGTPSPSGPRLSERANGTLPPTRHGHFHKLVTSPWDHDLPGSGVADHAQSSASPPPWGVGASPKANAVPVKRETVTDGPLRWPAGVEEGPDRGPDSPRLTKANPILYYMLQKGNGHLVRGSRGARAGPQPRVKEEPAAHPEDEDRKPNGGHHPHQPEEAPWGAIERLNGSLKKC